MATKAGAKETKFEAPAHAELDPAVAALLAEGWEDVGGGLIIPWSEGLTIRGRVVGLREGKFSTLVTISTAEGAITVGCPVILKNRLESVSINDDVYIRCLGKVMTDAGQEAWDFKVLRKQAAKP